MNTRRYIAAIIGAVTLAVMVDGCSKNPNGQRALPALLEGRKADEFVIERRQKWRQKASHVSQIVVGLERSKVLELMGEPDAKSDGPTVENWLFYYDAARNEEQIWIDAVVVQITGGKVSSVRQSPTRMGIEETLKNAEKKATTN